MIYVRMSKSISAHLYALLQEFGCKGKATNIYIVIWVNSYAP